MLFKQLIKKALIYVQLIIIKLKMVLIIDLSFVCIMIYWNGLIISNKLFFVNIKIKLLKIINYLFLFKYIK